MNRKIIKQFFLGGVVFLLAVSALTTFGHADWPAFRGPFRNGKIPHQPLPTEWSPTQNILWRTEIPGEGWSSPIVVGKHAYLTAAVADDPQVEDTSRSLQLLKISVDNGQIVEQVTLFRQPPDAPRIHKKNSHASPTPVVDGDRLYVHFGHQGTACISLDGEVIWKNESLSYSPVHGNGGSPAIVGDLVVFSRDGAEAAEIVALNKFTGSIAWRTRREVEVQRRFSFCTPLVAELGGKLQVILPGSNVVQSLDPKDGSELWRLNYEGFSVIPRPIVESGLIFVCTGYMRPSLLAIDPTGSGDVTDTHLRWRTNSNVPHTPSLIGSEGKIFMVSDQSGIVSCLDALSGEQLWKKRLGGNFSSSPLLVGSTLYLLDEEGICTVLDIDGEPREIAENKIGERCLSSLAVVDNDILLRSEAALYRISNEAAESRKPFAR